MPTAKPHWQINTERLAREILAAATASRTEEDLKMRVEPLLQRSFREAGIDVDIVQYEKRTAVAAKRMDAVYGHLVIEYKAPGKLAATRARTAAIEQLQGYLDEEAGRHGGDADGLREKAVGIVLDGEQILFLRFSRKAQLLTTPVPVSTGEPAPLPGAVPRAGYQVQGPFPIGPQSLASLLIYIRSAARRPLTAEHLAQVFGPGNEVARIAVAELYSAAMRGQRRSAFPRVTSFYAEWDRVFGAVYGEKLDKAGGAAEETARLYGLATGVRLKPLLFAIHTYYALLMKLMAHELLALQNGFAVASFVDTVAAADDRALEERLGYLESGSDFAALGVVNFLEADFFSWYLDVWSPRLALATRAVVRALAEFEPATPILEPAWTRDLLQKLYELIVPRALRHSLGEYYTPDWLAGHLVERSGYSGDTRTRFLDPACGSGTFLVQAIHRATEFAAAHSPARIAEVGRAILRNIVGFDLNPLAVLAARTNYLIAFARFLPYVRPLSLPVYLCDAVVPPDRYAERQASMLAEDTIVFHTRDHDYVFPLAMKDQGRIDRFCALVLEGLRSKLATPSFRRRLARELPLGEDERARLERVYEHIKQLDDQGRDGIWAHYIKNAFAPVYIGRFDFVVGNPPWIRWGYLSAEYRRRTLPLWQEYGLFSLKGHQARLGGGEKDFSMLFTYVAADRYLEDGGTLAFVITGEVFKSKGAGEGFRRFRLGETGAPLGVLWMEDMIALQPFQAANKTTLFALRKGEQTRYPVTVTEWRRNPGVGRITPDASLDQVLSSAERTSLEAVPINSRELASAWQTASHARIRQLGALKGRNSYKAWRGASTEPYGVFWLRLIEVRPDGRLVVENQHDRGKREIKPVRTALESTLVFPAVAGGNLRRYGIQDHFYALVCQDPARRAPYAEEWMDEHAPLTLGYLKQFESVLLSRGSNVVRQFAERTEFYAMYGIGAHTFAPYRVTWKRMANRMAATVLGKVATPYGRQPVISTDTTALIATTRRDEAHYLCALLNSEPVNAYIASFSEGGRGFGAPSVMQNVAIPKFDPAQATHRLLAESSQEAHRRVAQGQPLDDIDRQVDETTRTLWNIES